MKLTEIIQTKYSKVLSDLCHKSKNLYNEANWYIRQDYFKLENFLSYYDLDLILKSKESYRNLPSQTSQQILKVLSRSWKSFFKTNKDYLSNPKKYKKRPKLPHYKKKDGEFMLIFTNQQCKIKDGFLYFPKRVKFRPIKTRIVEKLKEVRIVPLGPKYKVEIVYEKEEQDLKLNKDNVLAIDLGLNNLITAVNNIGLKPIIVKGGVLKSINQYYNKQLALYKSIAKKVNGVEETKRIRRLYLTKNNKMIDKFHKISKKIIEFCVDNNIGTMVIGYNKGWKHNINIGKKNNQFFVQIPFSRLIKQLEYKSTMVGIQVILVNESYTSKCSFLDNEPIEKRVHNKGKRISRGLFRSSNGTIINADVNAGYNIMKKALPNAISADGIEDVGFHPCFISI